MFLFADEFLYNFMSWRTLWIAGRLGGGKTALAVALADYLVQRKHAAGVIANFPHALPLHPWREPAHDGRPRGIRGAVIIFDEAWQLLDRRTWQTNDRSYGAYARKLETFWIFPSVFALDIRLSILSCRRQTMIQTPFFQAWLYKWALHAPGVEHGGRFLWISPEKYFGTYDTRYVPIDDGDIKLLWRATLNMLIDDESAQESVVRTAASPIQHLLAGFGDEATE